MAFKYALDDTRAKHDEPTYSFHAKAHRQNRIVNPLVFFALGFALLALGIYLTRKLMLRLATSTTLDSTADLALRNTTRRRGRSLATIGVLASGVFMVIAVDSFRKTDTANPIGTGGFALIGESASPIYEDLNSQKGRDAYALDDKLMADVRVVQMRVRDGDDASCLNLNKAVQPKIIGVAPLQMAGRFSAKDQDGNDGWLEVNRDDEKWDGYGSNIPALVDANTLQWALKKKRGDFLDFEDERGKGIRIGVAATVPASILQGMILIAEKRFISAFHNSAGTRFFLIDCPPSKVNEVREHLTAQLSDRGLELIPAAQRLAEFNAVENTYLSIFQVLGGLGMLLGSAGLAIVVARNILERRREFGLLEALGYTPAQLRALVFAEHRWLIIAALGIGGTSALIAVLPSIIEKGATFPWGQLTVLLVGMAALSTFWVWLATRLALRSTLLGALRGE